MYLLSPEFPALFLGSLDQSHSDQFQCTQFTLCRAQWTRTPILKSILYEVGHAILTERPTHLCSILTERPTLVHASEGNSFAFF